MAMTIEERFEGVPKSRIFKNLMAKYDLSRKAVLDIGCSYGEYLIQFGPGSKGISINMEEVTYGKSNNLDIIYGNIESDNLVIKEKFDVIFANNLLEHLYSPHNFLIKIKKYLKEDGLLILGVPCVPKIEFLVNLKKFRGSLAEQHINFFTQYSLQKTVERAGWKIMSNELPFFRNKYMNKLLSPVFPHFYVVAKNDLGFKYTEKRMKELIGYANVF